MKEQLKETLKFAVKLFFILIISVFLILLIGWCAITIADGN